MVWSPRGDFLALSVCRYGKKKGKNLSFQISMVHVTERSATVEVPIVVGFVVDYPYFACSDPITLGAERVPFRSSGACGGSQE
jgi:hypothetical protein